MSAESPPPLDRAQLADMIERHADEVIAVVLAALRGEPASPEVANHSGGRPPAPTTQSVAGAPARAASTAANGRPAPWRKVDEMIEGFVAVWPAPAILRAQGESKLREHYPPMPVWETTDQRGLVRIAVGEPRERLPLYGKERGWISVWHVVNGRPQRQLANFVEVDDFETTRERAALISGKEGAAKKGFAPGEENLLPPVYKGMRTEVQRARLVGPNSRNRLVVVATAGEDQVMLDHALAHLHLRG